MSFTVLTKIPDITKREFPKYYKDPSQVLTACILNPNHKIVGRAEAISTFRAFGREFLLQNSKNVEQNFVQILWHFILFHLYTSQLCTFNNTELANMRTSEVQMTLAHSK